MKIIFFGSDDFALAHLKVLIASSHQVVACVTPTDKPKGRGLAVVFSPVKACALKDHIPVLQPLDLNDPRTISQLKALDSDLFVVIAYGTWLPPKVLEIPRLFTLNVHGSLLPRYRGAAPINWAIINGDRETGLTIMRLNSKMDAGDIVSQEKIPIDNNETAVTLRAKMMDRGPSFLLKTIETIEQRSFTFKPQDKNAVTLAPKLTKALGLIDWRKGACKIHNLVRGLVPWPTAYTYYRGKVLKILETEVVEENLENFEAGEVMRVTDQGFVVKTAEKSLFIKTVHLEASKPMNASDFVLGHKLSVGERLG